MKIVILGAGRVGYNTAKSLALEENDVSIIDSSEEVLNIVSEKLDVKPILGHAADINILREAGIEKADILIAVTSSDEINIAACQIVDCLFNVPTKIARVNNSSYFSNGNIFSAENLNINFVVSPLLETSKVVKRNISIPGALDVISCAGNRMRVIGVIAKRNSPISNIQLKYIRTIDRDSHVSIIYIKRSNGQCILPGKNDYIYPGDEVYFACASENVSEAMSFFGYSTSNDSSIVLIGGGNMCESIIKEVSNPAIHFKVIEKDLKTAEDLSEKLDNVKVIHGNPLDPEILDSAEVSSSEIVISLTDDDKINILSCLLSKKLGAKRVSVILNDFSYSDLLYSLGINTILDSRESAVSNILNYIRKGGIEEVISFNDEFDVIALEALDNSHAIGILTDDIISRNEIYIVAIVRGERITVRPKKVLIESGDKILFIIRNKFVDRVLKLFQEKPKYMR